MDIAAVDAGSDAKQLEMLHALVAAFWREDVPSVDPPGPVETRADVDSDSDSARGALLASVAGEPVGAAMWEAPQREDRDLIWGYVVVEPDRRRAGIGTALLHALRDLALPLGRDRLLTDTRDDRPGLPFLTAAGGVVGQADISSVLRLADADDRVVATWADDVAAGYRLRRWCGRCPDDLVAAFARAREAMNDAPRGELEMEDASWDNGRVRELEARHDRWGVQSLVTAAVHEETGDVAGFTEVLLVDRPTTALQEDTGVLRAHRGHGLGLSVKAANQRWLRDVAPHVTDIVTWNAEENAHMRAVNTRLGYRAVGRWFDVTVKL